MKTSIAWIFLFLLFSACGGSKLTAKQPAEPTSNKPIIQTPPKSQTSFTAVEGSSQQEDSAIYERYRISAPAQITKPDRSMDTAKSAPALKPSEKHGLSDDLPKK